MPQSLAKIYLHIIFGTKDRKDIIPNIIKKALYAYIAGVCNDKDSHACRIGGTGNHIHIACTLPRTITVSKLLEEIKRASSIWMKEQDSDNDDFAWQAGYGVFSIGQSQLDALVAYIDNQETHHETSTFEEELVALFDKYEVKYDPKYVWQ